jgi:hypothetical protein
MKRFGNNRASVRQKSIFASRRSSFSAPLFPLLFFRRSVSIAMSKFESISDIENQLYSSPVPDEDTFVLSDESLDLLMEIYESTVLYPPTIPSPAITPPPGLEEPVTSSLWINPRIRTYRVYVSCGVFISDAITYILSHYPAEHDRILHSMSMGYVQSESSAMIFTFTSELLPNEFAEVMAHSNDLRLMEIFKEQNIHETPIHISF